MTARLDHFPLSINDSLALTEQLDFCAENPIVD